MPRRIAAPQFVNHLGIGEPGRNFSAFVQPAAKFGSRDIQHASAILHFVFRNVAVLVFQIDHHVERHHGDADLGLVLLE